MSAEVVTIKKLAKALQGIAKLDELEDTGEDYIYDGTSVAVEVTSDVRIGLCHAARIARHALEGIVVT